MLWSSLLSVSQGFTSRLIVIILLVILIVMKASLMMIVMMIINVKDNDVDQI